jgi:hypothetical protein
LKGSLEKNYNSKNKFNKIISLDLLILLVYVLILNNTVLIVRDSARSVPRLWEIQCRILDNAISIVRNSASTFRRR